MKRLLLATAAAAALAACGDLKDAVQDRLNAKAADIQEAAVEQSAYAADAYEAAAAGDDADAYLEEDDTGVSAFGGPQVGPGGAPGDLLAAAPGAPQAGNPDVTVTVVRYDCGLSESLCRPQSITATGDLKNRRGEIVGSVSATSSFNYYSALGDALAGGAGDKDTAVLARDSYVRAGFTVTRTMKDRQGNDVTLTTAGHRVWSTIAGEWYVVDAAYETTGFPSRDDGRPAVSSTTFSRSFAVPDTTATSGRSERTVTFADGATDNTVRYATYDRASGHMTGTWLHTGPRGFRGEGEFDVDLNGTPFCRLDDSGTISVDRTFGEAVTRVVSEHVDIVRDGTVTTIDGTLTAADGATRTKSLTRTQVKPTDCSQDGAAREYTLEGTTYRGAEISLDVKTSPGSLVIDGSRTLKNGNVETVHVVRSEGVMNIDGDLTDANGQPLGSMHIVVHPDGSGKGTITRILADGTKVTRDFEIVKGRPVVTDGKGKREEVE